MFHEKHFSQHKIVQHTHARLFALSVKQYGNNMKFPFLFHVKLRKIDLDCSPDALKFLLVHLFFRSIGVLLIPVKCSTWNSFDLNKMNLTPLLSNNIDFTKRFPIIPCNNSISVFHEKPNSNFFTNISRYPLFRARVHCLSIIARGTKASTTERRERRGKKGPTKRIFLQNKGSSRQWGLIRKLPNASALGKRTQTTPPDQDKVHFFNVT